jgi:uncharacterized repeat protein (TIGR01451 family)
VTNVGNVDLTKLDVTDPTLGPVTCAAPAAPGLAPGASETCTADATSTVTQADVDAGHVTDTATATGTDTQGDVSPKSPPSSVTIDTVTAAPAVTVQKIAAASDGDTNPLVKGETIKYSYLVTNTGNVDLPTITVTDPTLGPVTCPTPGHPGLTPGQSETCTADTTYVVTQADVNTGQVTDTATATGTDTQGNKSPDATSTVTVPTVIPSPAVAIDKKATVTPAADQNAAQLGDTIAYTYVVTNTGNVDLKSVAVSDPTIGAVACPTPAAPGLDPGASETCTADVTHTVDQADLDAGQVTDTATATGTDNNGKVSPISAPSTATVETTAPTPSVSVKKIADASLGDTSQLQVGETINYSYLVTNTGNVDLTSVAVDDPTLGPVTCPVPAAPGLAPGASETCTANATYTVTQTDVDNGSVTDTATGTGTDGTDLTAGPNGLTSPTSPPSSVTIPEPASPTVAIDKTATVTPSADQGAAKLGDTIAYTYKVTNTGNVDLTSVAVSDPTLGRVTCPIPATPGLAPAASETCTADATHTVTQADLDAGKVVDTATATGTDTNGLTGPVSDPSTATVHTGAAAPAVSIKKTADASAGDGSKLKVGETIKYSYLVTNTGNVDLKTVAVADPTLGRVTCPTPAPPGLAPGASETCHADITYTVTQKDVDRGHVSDTATATGVADGGQTSPRSAPSTVTIPEAAAPSVSIDKMATVTPAKDKGGVKVGDKIAYSYKVTNTGNVDLTKLRVSDPSIGAVTCPTLAPPGLAPGASETCTADHDHTVTQADVDAGKVVDTATATGTDPGGKTSHPSAPSTVTVPAVAAAPSVALKKTATVTPAADQSAAQKGDTIAYTFKVTNTGNVDLKSLAVSDPTGGAVTCPVPTAPGLAPGASETCTGTTPHTVTQADVNAGEVQDTATATGTDTRGLTSPRSDPSTATVTTVGLISGAATVTPVSTAPNGLGQIGTDLGRWVPGHGWTALGIGLGAIGIAIVGGTGLLFTRRRRRRQA